MKDNKCLDIICVMTLTWVHDQLLGRTQNVLPSWSKLNASK